MSASSRCSIIKLDTAIVSLGNTSTPLYDAAQIGSSLNSLNNAFCRVATVADLPPVADNEGRFIYVEDIKSFRYSDGYYWTKDACSVLGDVNTYSSLWSWGLNTNGILGDGTTVNRCSPGTVAGGDSWCFIVSGRSGIGAIKTDGTLWTWGDNTSGRLGDGTTVNRCSPGTVAGGGTNWCQVSITNHSVTSGSSLYSSAAIKTDGTLWTWGANFNGQLGNGTIAARCSPGTTWGSYTNWCSVSVGYFGMLAIKTNGTLWTWGCGGLGELGDGTTLSRCSPGTIWGNDTTWCKIASSITNGLAAIKTDGTLWTWGSNCALTVSGGQLGDGTTVSRCSPGTVAGGGTTWCQISIGGHSASAIKTDGTLWTWGTNSTSGTGDGRLGDGTTVARCSPGTVVGGGTTWCSTFIGGAPNSACSISIIALKTDGTLWTWGGNCCGRLGDGTILRRCSPGTVAHTTNAWKTIGGSSAIRTRGF